MIVKETHHCICCFLRCYDFWNLRTKPTEINFLTESKKQVSFSLRGKHAEIHVFRKWQLKCSYFSYLSIAGYCVCMGTFVCVLLSTLMIHSCFENIIIMWSLGSCLRRCLEFQCVICKESCESRENKVAKSNITSFTSVSFKSIQICDLHTCRQGACQRVFMSAFVYHFFTNNVKCITPHVT